MCFAIISGSGMCNASQLRISLQTGPLSITSMVVQLDLLKIRQYNIVPSCNCSMAKAVDKAAL